MARLTGAVSLVILLAAGAIGAIGATGAGWWRLRRIGSITVIVGRRAVTAGEPVATVLRIAGDGPGPLRTHPVHATVLDRGRVVASGWVHHGELGADATFVERGVVDRVTVRLASGGAAGLCWWRRTFDVACHELAIAPAPGRASATVDDDATGAGRSGELAPFGPAVAGEVDGVRPWREGDADHTVHWPTTLRTGSLTVFDHRRTSDVRHVVHVSTHAPDLDAAAAGARAALDDLVRRGQQAWASLDDAEPVHLCDLGAIARWTAAIAPPDPPAQPPSRRRRRWRVEPAEPVETLTARARWSVAITCCIALVMLTGALGSGPVTTASLVGGCLLTAAMTSGGTTSRALRFSVHALVVVFTGVGLVTVLRTVATSDDLMEVITGPLPQVLMLLVVLHGFECTRRRAARAALGFSAVIVAYAAGQRIDPALTWWTLAWGVGWIASMAAVASPPAAGGPRSAGASAGASVDVRWRAPALARRAVPIVGALVVGTVATVLALGTVSVPAGPARLGLPSSIDDIVRVDAPGGIADASGRDTSRSSDRDASSRTGSVGGYPGFDHALDTSMRGDLGDDVVMRVRAPEPDFWRGQTFSTFDGRRWTVDDNPGTWHPGPDVDIDPAFGDVPNPVVARTEDLLQTFYVEFDQPNMLFAAYRPERVIVEGDVFARADGALRTDVVLTAGAVYTVVSERTLVTAELLARQGRVERRLTDIGRDAFAAQLAVPPSTTERTVALAAELAAGTTSTYELVRAMESWIVANVRYDLEAPVPAEGRDAVDDLLFGSKRGFCEQIATALTIMLRTQGVPARLATGYVPGTRDRVTGLWEVRASDAHAWVEVWFPKTGWQAFDPTADVPFAGEAARPTVGGDLARAVADAIATHGGTIAAVAGAATAALLVGWAAARSIARARYRRRRGAWGILHDRFVAAAADVGIDEHATNPERARRWAHAEPDRTSDVVEVAQVLDRVAFDPSFADDATARQRVATVVGELERRRVRAG